MIESGKKEQRRCEENLNSLSKFEYETTYNSNHKYKIAKQKEVTPSFGISNFLDSLENIDNFKGDDFSLEKVTSKIDISRDFFTDEKKKDHSPDKDRTSCKLSEVRF